MTAIYFPVRSNVHYFDLGRLDLDLESRIKLASLLYDELVFDDGAYIALIGPTLTLDMRFPTQAGIPEGLLEAQSPPEGGVFSLILNGVEMRSEARRRYQLSYRPLLRTIGIQDENWVRFSTLDFTDETKEEVKRLANEDLAKLHEGDRETYLLESQILKSLNFDWIMASIHQWDLNLNPLHARQLVRKLSLVAEATGVARPLDFDDIFPRLPDVSLVDWAAIFEMREAEAFVKFRKNFQHISSDARAAYLEGASADAIRYHLQSIRDDQLLDEIRNLMWTPKQVAVDSVISLALIVGSALPPIGPFLGAIDSLRTVIGNIAEYTRQQQSLAASFLQKEQKRKNE